MPLSEAAKAQSADAHPTRDCGCKVFRTPALAEKYVAEQVAS